jgi:hypothetical protein
MIDRVIELFTYYQNEYAASQDIKSIGQKDDKGVTSFG